MFQTIDGVDVFVVDLPHPPSQALPVINDGGPGVAPYVDALNTAIANGTITEGGKYGINVSNSGVFYNCFKIIE